MKRLLSILLTLTMCLSLMTFTVSAVDGVSKSAQGITVTIDKSNYQPGEKYIMVGVALMADMKK